VIEVTNFNTVVKQHPVALPIEPIRKKDVSFCSLGNNSESRAIDFLSCANSIAKFQIDLIGVWLGQRVGLPNRHISILPQMRRVPHVPPGMGAERPVHSPACEEFCRDP